MIDSSAIIQIGIVVSDIEAAAAAYAKLFQMEVPAIRNAFPDVHYKAELLEAKARLCSFAMGAVHVELIEPGDSPSSWKQFLSEHGNGVHHLGITVKDRESALEALAEGNAFPIQYGGAAWGSYTIIESAQLLGVNLNIKCNEAWPTK